VLHSRKPLAKRLMPRIRTAIPAPAATPPAASPTAPQQGRRHPPPLPNTEAAKDQLLARLRAEAAEAEARWKEEIGTAGSVGGSAGSAEGSASATAESVRYDIHHNNMISLGEVCPRPACCDLVPAGVAATAVSAAGQKHADQERHPDPGFLLTDSVGYL
jgi:hypothetical protein